MKNKRLRTEKEANSFSCHATDLGAGNLHSVTDELDRTIQYECDDASRVIRQAVPGDHKVNYGYEKID